MKPQTPYTLTGIIRIAKFFLVFLVMAHYLSCAMFFIGTMDSFDSFGNPTTWLTQTSIVNSNGETQQLALAPLAEQYLWTLYWTITTMTTVGFGDIHPITEAEVIMSIVTMIIGGGVFSFIVGNTASLLTRLDSQSAELEDLLERVADFMQSNRIPMSLRDQCARWIKFQHGNSVQIPKLLCDSLSDSLRAELHVFVNRGFLERTAVLSRHLPSKRREVGHRDDEHEGDDRNRDDRFLGLLLEKCREEHYCPGEIIFLEGCKGPDMYFIEQGQVDVTRKRAADGSESCVLTTLYTGAVFGEASFISKDNDRRNYTARSRTWLKLKVIKTKDLTDITMQFPRLRAAFADDLKKYSEQFERSMALSMLLDESIGTAVKSDSSKVEQAVVDSILDSALLVRDWQDPESVRCPIPFGYCQMPYVTPPLRNPFTPGVSPRLQWPASRCRNRARGDCRGRQRCERRRHRRLHPARCGRRSCAVERHHAGLQGQARCCSRSSVAQQFAGRFPGQGEGSRGERQRTEQIVDGHKVT